MLDEKRIQEITEAWKMMCERLPTSISLTRVEIDRDAFMRMELAINDLRSAEQGGWIALKKYGRHAINCKSRSIMHASLIANFPDDSKCTCGFTEALAAAPKKENA